MNQQQMLTISIVTFHPELQELQNTLNSLMVALDKLGCKDVSITIIDNSNNVSVPTFLKTQYPNRPLRVIHGQGNIGFGRGHNLALTSLGEFHLVLNPDIKIHPDAILNAIEFMKNNQRCGLLTPYAEWPSGERQYLCKRYPAIFDLILRGFAPKSVRCLFNKRLSRYEMRQQTQNDIYWNPLIVSGCFMFFRGSVLKIANGFSEGYFLYFEDFDLSIKVHNFSDVAYVPTVRVVHTGGHAAKKGLWHIQIFIRSATQFYRRHGLKIF
ncbi:glycosyltransferase family 2 protein [Brucella sp. RRSP16]|uniref:glycosyltransferase family 2 protein n=1 Tax=Brucella sp. RRSP16 TaxID=3453707 RepID=UPI003FCD542A